MANGDGNYTYADGSKGRYRKAILQRLCSVLRDDTLAASEEAKALLGEAERLMGSERPCGRTGSDEHVGSF